MQAVKRRHFRLVGLLALVAVLGLAAWRAAPQRPQPVARCEHPLALAWHGPVLVLCAADSSGLSMAEVLDRGGLERCQGSHAPRRIQPGQLVRVSAACAVSVEPLPARLALALGRPLDLNRASAAELQALPRIGPTLAARVVRERSRGGPFCRVEQLARVKGIGRRVVARLRGLISVGRGCGR